MAWYIPNTPERDSFLKTQREITSNKRNAPRSTRKFCENRKRERLSNFK